MGVFREIMPLEVKTIWFESTLERDFILKQEFNNNVIDVIGQPVVIPTSLNWVTNQPTLLTF